ncbi:MAG: DUF3618 domain-containing protein [Sphingomonas sp.]|nr:DUF3618 domain-containing protein [Sphingomonas sp.]
MTDTQTDTTQDPAAIEKDIRRTQEDMSRTVDKIGDQLTPKNIFNALLDKADENDVDARMLLDGARRNPIALGLIAAGAIWLVSDKDSKFPTVSDKFGKSSDDDFDGSDSHHRDYVSHMSSVEMRDDEDSGTYQRRRDLARANFLMVERGQDEDDHGFRERLDSMTEKFREKRRAWSDSSAQAADATKDTARMAVNKTQDFYSSKPLVGGILAAAVGAAFGSTLPITRQEQETLGNVGEKARNVATEQKDQIASKLSEKKDEVLEKADQKLQQSGTDQQSGFQQQASQTSPQFSRT